MYIITVFKIDWYGLKRLFRDFKDQINYYKNLTR